MNDDAVTALYTALAPTTVQPIEGLKDIEADRLYTQSVAAEWALRFQLARKLEKVQS